MSDSNSSAPETVTGDAEPSMEDILASIRKVIAADKDVEADENISAAVEPDDATAGVDDSEEDILDLVSFVDENTQAPEEPSLLEDEDSIFNLKPEDVQPEPELVSADLELEDLAVETTEVDTAATTPDVEIGFDESLDLVMDADASDYITTRIEKAPVVEELDTELETLTDEIEDAAEDADSIFSKDIEILDDDEPVDEVAEESSGDLEEVGASDEVIEDIVQDEPVEMDTEVEIEVDEPQSENDIDLVKSLLSDLMDEPEVAEEELALEAESEEPEDDINSVLDDLLADSLEEEVADAVSQVELPDEPDLQDIAKVAAANTDVQPAAADNPGDEVVLEMPDAKSQFALLAGATAAAGATVLATDDDEDAPVETAAEIEVESEQEQTPEPESKPHSEIKEEEPMATRATKKNLVDEETERETSEVFASLTSAVKEKTKLEESGPPIGDLVQEALKPMLQDWLDKNLKGIVERAVKAEVKRISSGK